MGALEGAAHGLGLALSLVAAGRLERHRKDVVRDMADPPSRLEQPQSFGQAPDDLRHRGMPGDRPDAIEAIEPKRGDKQRALIAASGQFEHLLFKAGAIMNGNTQGQALGWRNDLPVAARTRQTRESAEQGHLNATGTLNRANLSRRYEDRVNGP
jgi:hypothetical protein